MHSLLDINMSVYVRQFTLRIIIFTVLIKCDCVSENPTWLALASVLRNTILKIQFKTSQSCLGIGPVH